MDNLRPMTYDGNDTNDHFDLTPCLYQGEEDKHVINGDSHKNVEEKQLYSFLDDNELLLIYGKLKSLELYVDHLLHLSRPEFDAICD